MRSCDASVSTPSLPEHVMHVCLLQPLGPSVVARIYDAVYYYCIIVVLTITIHPALEQYSKSTSAWTCACVALRHNSPQFMKLQALQSSPPRCLQHQGCSCLLLCGLCCQPAGVVVVGLCLRQPGMHMHAAVHGVPYLRRLYSSSMNNSASLRP
jgi:hypothetical protein